MTSDGEVVQPTWFLATGEDQGCPLVFRVREAPPRWATIKEDFQRLLAVTWQFDANANNGMPLPHDLERMLELENLLEPVFANARQAFLTVVVTGNGVREWQWYARDSEAVMMLVNETLGQLDPFPVQFSFQDDPAWIGYSRFLEIQQSVADAPPEAWFPTI
jgi:hypothetical protein